MTVSKLVTVRSNCCWHHNDKQMHGAVEIHLSHSDCDSVACIPLTSKAFQVGLMKYQI
jgi:hypothetical protein